LGRFLDIDQSSELESHTKGRTTPVGADHLCNVVHQYLWPLMRNETIIPFTVERASD